MSLPDEFHDLEMAEAGEEPDFTTEPEAPGDDLKADQFVIHVARLRRDRAAAEEIAALRTDRIQTWLAGRQAQIDGQIAWFEAALATYHAAVLRTDRKRKTIHLPAGTHVARAQQPELVIDDEAVFMAWAREHAPELINPGEPAPPKPKPDRNAMKKQLRESRKGQPGDRLALFMPLPDDESGELIDVEVPGVSLLVRGDSFTTKPNEGDTDLGVATTDGEAG